MRPLIARTYALVLFILIALLGGPAYCENLFPTRPVRIIVAFGPGQATDIIARLVAQDLTALWKQQVFVENIAGGNSITGTVTGLNARPDGYTLTFGT